MPDFYLPIRYRIKTLHVSWSAKNGEPKICNNSDDRIQVAESHCRLCGFTERRSLSAHFAETRFVCIKVLEIRVELMMEFDVLNV